MIAKTIIVARVGGGEQKSGLSEKKRVEEKMVFFKKMFAMDRDVKKKRRRGRLMIVSKLGNLSVRMCLF